MKSEIKRKERGVKQMKKNVMNEIAKAIEIIEKANKVQIIGNFKVVE